MGYGVKGFEAERQRSPESEEIRDLSLPEAIMKVCIRILLVR